MVQITKETANVLEYKISNNVNIRVFLIWVLKLGEFI